MNNKIDRRYLAGLIDGEGCIYFTKKSDTEKNKRETYVNLRLSISNTYKPLMDRLHDEFGGYLRIHTDKYRFKSGRYRKMGYDLVLCNKQAENLIHECLPYFIIKKERAEIALDIRKNVFKYQGYIVPEKEMQKRKNLIDKLRELNKKGVPSLEFEKQLACVEC